MDRYVDPRRCIGGVEKGSASKMERLRGTGSRGQPEEEEEAYQCEVAVEKEEERKRMRERERERKEKCIMKILELIIAVKVGQEIPVRSSSTGARYSLKASDA